MGRSNTPAWLISGALLSALPLWAAAPARACSIAVLPPFVIDTSLRETDSTPPSPFQALRASPWREAGTRCSGARCTASSCGDRAGIDVSFSRPVDDQSALLGYRLVWLHGDMPDGLDNAIRQPQPLPPGTNLSLSISFESAPRMNGDFALIAVDQAGNESEPSAPVHVEFSGCTRYFDDHASCTETACSVANAPGAGASRGALAAWLVGAAALVLCSHRRRKRSA